LERLSLISSSGHGGNAGAGMMVKVADLRVQAQEFLCMFFPLESLLGSGKLIESHVKYEPR